jgi:hypothetical protein
MSFVVISAPEHMGAVRKRLREHPAVQVFADTESLQALETIQTALPKIVALNPSFAATARGAALVAQLKTDSRLTETNVRVLIEDEDRVPLLLADKTAPPEKALLQTSRPLGRAGTRAALRYGMDRRAVVVNGQPSALVDLSTTGAQVLLSTRVRPGETVRIVLPSEDDEARFRGIVVWSVAVPAKASIDYRAGVKLSNPDSKWIENYCQQSGGRPDLTFGVE